MTLGALWQSYVVRGSVNTRADDNPAYRVGGLDVLLQIMTFVRKWLTLYGTRDQHEDHAPSDAPRRRLHRYGLIAG